MSGRTGSVQGPPHVVCDVCGNREVAVLILGPGYIACEPRDIPFGTLPAGAVRGHHRWAPRDDREETVLVWCDDEHHHGWLAFSKIEAIAAAKKRERGVVRALPEHPGLE